MGLTLNLIHIVDEDEFEPRLYKQTKSQLARNR